MKRKYFLLFGLIVLLKPAYSQTEPTVNELGETFRTTYVHSFQELIEVLERKNTEDSVFFFSYDEGGHIVHSVPILIPNLIRFILKYECDLPPFCVVLLDNEAIRKVE